MKKTARKVFGALVDRAYFMRFVRGSKPRRKDDKPGEWILHLPPDEREALAELTPAMTQDRILEGGE